MDIMDIRCCPKCGSGTNTYRHPGAKVWCPKCGFVLREEGVKQPQKQSQKKFNSEEKGELIKMMDSWVMYRLREIATLSINSVVSYKITESKALLLENYTRSMSKRLIKHSNKYFEENYNVGKQIKNKRA